MIGQFLSRVKLGLGFGLGFYFFYLLRVEQFIGQTPPRYPRAGYEYDFISRFLVETGTFIGGGSYEDYLFSRVLFPVNVVAFSLFVFKNGRGQTLIWEIQIGIFLILDIVLAYDVLWNDFDHIVYGGQYTLFNYYLPLGLGVYLFFLLHRISNQIASDRTP